jgi:hypothetical protein
MALSDLHRYQQQMGRNTHRLPLLRSRAPWPPYFRPSQIPVPLQRLNAQRLMRCSRHAEVSLLLAARTCPPSPTTGSGKRCVVGYNGLGRSGSSPAPLAPGAVMQAPGATLCLRPATLLPASRRMRLVLLLAADVRIPGTQARSQWLLAAPLAVALSDLRRPRSIRQP